MWEIDIGVQSTGLLWAVLLGVASAVLYNALRAVNKVFCPNGVVVFFMDVFYWLILTLAFFIYFMVFTNGQVRLFAFFGALAGFIFSFLCFSKIFLVLFSRILLVFKFVLNKIKRFFICVWSIFKKLAKNFKKTLKKDFFKTKNS